MRWQLAPLGLFAAALAGWVVFQPGDPSRDLVVARDRLLESPGLVATFSPGGAEGYRFVAIEGEGWVWERTSGPGGNVRFDALIYNGSEHLLRVANGCFVPITGVREPLIPGLTVAQRLVSREGLRRVGDTRAEYGVDASPFLTAPPSPANAAVLVTEVLSAVREGSLRVDTEPSDSSIRVWTGTYSIAQTTPDELREASELIASAVASDYAEVRFHERVTGPLVLSTALLGPYSVLIPENCTDSPVMLGSAVRGGQVEGLRSAPSPIRFSGQSPPMVLEAMTTRLRIRAPIESFNAEMAAGTLGTVPITEAGVILISITRGSGIAVQVLSCTAKPWFAC